MKLVRRFTQREGDAAKSINEPWRLQLIEAIVQHLDLAQAFATGWACFFEATRNQQMAKHHDSRVVEQRTRRERLTPEMPSGAAMTGCPPHR